MTDPLKAGDNSPAGPADTAADLAGELLRVVQSVAGVSTAYPAQPLWQSIAGAALSVVTGEAPPLISVAIIDDVVTVKARIGVSTSRPAPEVARDVADAVRKHLLPRSAAVDVSVVKVGT